ncbi:uncharacterized protein LOC108678851 [Hyalella azteca]|uniref:Uncharacterized protein LOC108678851 n=1 Tax=Hyalella azteca TaxID=294128 RepID=A0A8B7P9U2_HYAAZ|nr:uncharacterized protein LOC108678851 [Hyalella azteca]
MHNVSDDAVNSGWHAELSTQMSSESCKVEADATEASGSSPPLETVAVYIKEEPQGGGEDIAVKVEPTDSSEKECGSDSGSSRVCAASASRRGSAMNSSDNVKLILAVEKHPAVWDKACSDYKDKNKKVNAWKTICKEVTVNHAEIKDDEAKNNVDSSSAQYQLGSSSVNIEL